MSLRLDDCLLLATQCYITIVHNVVSVQLTTGPKKHFGGVWIVYLMSFEGPVPPTIRLLDADGP